MLVKAPTVVDLGLINRRVTKSLKRLVFTAFLLDFSIKEISGEQVIILLVVSSLGKNFT